MERMDESHIRARTSALVSDWAGDRQPPFTGERSVDFADAITVAHLVAEEAKSNLERWITAARRAGVTWIDIGNALGISKQAAQQRYRPATKAQDPVQKSARGVLEIAAFAVDEPTILRREGRRGNELIDVNESTLFFRHTRSKWEYRRLIETSLEIYKMPQDGWTHVRSLFPFSYFKRIVQ